MANIVTARFNDNCKVHVAMSNDTTVTKAVIIDAVGNETDIGGGGGESDFSTAEVTMTNTTGNNLHVNAIALIDFLGDLEMVYDILLINNQPSSCKAILYKGKQQFTLPENTEAAVTGDISYDAEYNDITITGAGTITISSSTN